MANFTLTPEVDETREFLEIARDFSNPLDLVREAISNSFDADATRMALLFDTVDQLGEKTLRIRIKDDGNGMDKEELKAFFDLGNSINAEKPGTIGEKGHGTKVYFNSAVVRVDTVKDGIRYKATLEQPLRELSKGRIPEVDVASEDAELDSGTSIEVLGYNRDRMSIFTHERLKDHILWFTKFGSVEQQFAFDSNEDVVLELKGLNEEEPETLSFGHDFPEENADVDALFDEHFTKAPGYYCKRFHREGNLPNHPDVKYQAVFSVEGRYVKYSYNPMLRRSGYQAPPGAYRTDERYGLWVCKDFIPVQRKNEWLTKGHRGWEFTRLHAFVNCQGLRLTANRGSVDNTPEEIKEDLQTVISELHEEITETDDWTELEWLQEQAEARRTIKKERKEYNTRRKQAEEAKVAEYKGVELIEPVKETGVYGLLVQLLTIEPDLFDFDVVSYDTHSGIDLLAQAGDQVPVAEAEVYFIELKHVLRKRKFNHSFENTYSIVSWDTDLSDGDVIRDIADKERRFKVIDEEDVEYTMHFLEWPTEGRRIEVIVLKKYLPEKLGLRFASRAEG